MSDIEKVNTFYCYFYSTLKPHNDIILLCKIEVDYFLYSPLYFTLLTYKTLWSRVYDPSFKTPQYDLTISAVTIQLPKKVILSHLHIQFHTQIFQLFGSLES